MKPKGALSKTLTFALAFVMLTLLPTACSGAADESAPAPGAESAAETDAAPADAAPALAPGEEPAGAGTGEPANADTPTQTGKEGNPMAVITMEKGGVIEIEFYPEDAPTTVETFTTLTKKGFYDGLTFHRVEPGFVVQGGDPNGNGTGGPGYTVKAEFNRRPHQRGAVAMARSAHPDSAGSQFYNCFATAPHLDGQYTVFGQVVNGMDVVDGIQVGDKMKSVVIKE